ncbi:hypothetical protein D9611_011080 [Ephemerocybe angulata]|uniref:Uncharacterized protein n=1 Tax=Ephemerocybe angulata TaxID=980116 RepID=A0A8H5BAV1_9AGAR|nr:hypothetical protein D9611_011080 [Tulosesus angulatus]
MSNVKISDIVTIGATETNCGLKKVYDAKDVNFLVAGVLMNVRAKVSTAELKTEYEEILEINSEWMELKEGIAQNMHRCLTRYGGVHTEAYAREVMNCILNPLIDLRRGRAQLYWETVLSTSDPSASGIPSRARGFTRNQIKLLEDPTTFEYRSHLLSLTGFTDYIMVSVPANRINAHNRDDGDTEMFNMNKIIEHYRIFQNPDVRLFFIEAKSLAHKNLEGHIAQVVSETIYEEVRILYPRRDSMTWTLSNGFEWFFGVCWVDTATNLSGAPLQRYTYFCIKTQAPLETPRLWQLEAKGKMMDWVECMKPVFKVLVLWAFTHPKHIVDLFVEGY